MAVARLKREYGLVSAIIVSKALDRPYAPLTPQAEPSSPGWRSQNARSGPRRVLPRSSRPPVKSPIVASKCAHAWSCRDYPGTTSDPLTRTPRRQTDLQPKRRFRREAYFEA